MKKIDMIKEWFRKADNDLLNIENNLKAENVPTDTVCFHSQQAVEKYLKGFLLLYDIEFKHSHDLVYLIDLTLEIDKEFDNLIYYVEKLNDFAIKVRYPYFIVPSLDEAKESYRMALKVKEFILKKVRLDEE